MGKTMFMLVYVILGVICLYHANLLACVVWIFCGIWAGVLHAVIRVVEMKQMQIVANVLDDVLTKIKKELDKNEPTEKGVQN